MLSGAPCQVHTPRTRQLSQRIPLRLHIRGSLTSSWPRVFLALRHSLWPHPMEPLLFTGLSLFVCVGCVCVCVCVCVYLSLFVYV